MRVHRAGGLHEHEDLGVHEQRPGQGHPLTLAARQRPALLGQVAVEASGHRVEHVVGVGQRDDAVQVALGRAASPIHLPTKDDVSWALNDPVYDVQPWDSTVTQGFRNKLEGWGTGSGSASWHNHNRVHRWVGGAMLGAASVNDPVFWLHHAYLDMQWERWQGAHSSHRYLPAAPPGTGDAQHGRVVARHDKLPPWSDTPDQLEDMSGVYRYE